jgi:archaellin
MLPKSAGSMGVRYKWWPAGDLSVTVVCSRPLSDFGGVGARPRVAVAVRPQFGAKDLISVSVQHVS